MSAKRSLKSLRFHTRMLSLALLLAIPGGMADVMMTKQQALAYSFPEADRIEKEILYFSDAERRRVTRLARAEMDSGLFTVYRGYRNGRLLGYAFIDTRTIRSKPAVFLVVVNPDGSVRETRVLAWEEPPEYQPPEGWLRQFEGQRLDDRARLGHEVHAISGASLTSRSLADGIRRTLAIREVKFAGEG